MFNSTKILPLEAPPADGNLVPLPPSQEIEEELQAEQNKSNQAPATHTKTIEIIHPPPDIRAIIHSTAKYVSDNGPEFEKKVIAENAENARFNFLRSSNPYHAFYQQKLRAQTQASDLKPADEGEANPDLQAQFRVPPKPLEAPEPDKYTVRLPEGMKGEELDIIKLTAQFVARNGQSFFNGLQSKENNNPLFHFMKPTHRMFPFFNALVNVYSDVLRPPKDLKEKLRKSATYFTTVRGRCLNRLEWDRSQEQLRKKEEDEKELERVQMAMIDWNDFSIVASIDFSDEEDERLPPPTTYEEVTTMAEDELVEMEMDEEDGGSMQIENVNGEEEETMRIVKKWKRPEDRIPMPEVVISPITSELIPINEMSEHMRILLINPKFKEQKDRMFAKIRDTTLAHDDEIAKNIVGLARLRPDIFGTTEEEVSNAVKAEIEKMKDEQPKQVIWDGHTGSSCRTTNQALTQNSNRQEQGNGIYGYSNSFPPPGPGVLRVRPFPPPPNLALNFPCPPQYPGAPRPLGVPVMQPMHQQHQLLMPRPPGHLSMMMNRPPQMQPPSGSQFAHLQVSTPYGPPSMGMMHPPPPPVEAQPPLPEEPEPKRQKVDESALVPEDEFLAQHPGCATIRVSVPNVDDGKFIEITVQSLSENVATLKEKIAGATQIPANKQKLSGKAGFLKDNMSLANYNVEEGQVLTLSLRERGGRKR